VALIDRNGPGLPLLGSFWSNSVIPPIDFCPGDRHRLLIVDFDGDVGVLKSFRKRKAEFVNELETASALHAAGCGVPDILHVDFDQLEIVLRELVTEHERLLEVRAAGVTILLVDQNVTKAVEISDYLYMLEIGRVRREGPRQAFADQLREIIRDSLLGA